MTSRLEELIAELCPNGVEYKKIGDIGKVSMCKRILKNQTNPVGDIPFYKIGTFGKKADSFISNKLFQEYKQKYSFPNKGDILISAAGTIGRVVVYDGEPAYFQDSNIVWVANDEKKILNSFLYYIYQLEPWKVSSGGTISRLYNENIAGATIPVPPLEVQSEIVRILDTFTEFTAELTAELTARKKQYGYYRDTLLTFDDNNPIHSLISRYCPNGVEYKNLKELGSFFGGLTGKNKNDFVDGNARYITYKNVYCNAAVDFSANDFVKVSDGEKQNVLQYGDVIFTGSSETPDECGFSSAVTCHLNEEVYLNSFCFAFRFNDVSVMNPDFSKYLFRSTALRSQIKRTANGVTRFNVSKALMGKVTIPVPPLEVQRQIVQILDRFDALCNDLTQGLPAEIEARRKQYEYYRDQLLTFKRA